jgi:hypothetical protein
MPAVTVRYAPIRIFVAFALFAALAGNGVVEYFGGDDVANLYRYLGHPLTYWIRGLAKFWSSAWYRPFGGVVYLTLFKSFGFHPLPFKIFLFAVLLLNMLLFLRVANTLSGSALIGSWALLFFAYHAALNGLYLNFGTIYDVLGFSFYFSGVLLYARWLASPNRTRRVPLALTALYIAGLTCKEMTVTLPAVLLLWNVLLSDAPKQEKWKWPARSGLPVLVGFAVAALYTVGKMSGPDTLASQAQYAPHFSIGQFATLTAHYMRELFYLPAGFPSPAGALWILAALLAIALLLRSGLLFFCVCAIIATQLPVSFMSPRGAFAVYIPFAFWCLYAAVLADRATRSFRNPDLPFVCYVVVAIALGLTHLTMKDIYDPAYTDQAAEYSGFSDMLDRWNIRLQPGKRVLLLNDPFRADWIGWDACFLMNVRSGITQAVVNRVKFATVIPPLAEVASYDYVIDYDAADTINTWRLLKAPGLNPAGATGRMEELATRAPVLLTDGFLPPTQPGWRPVAAMFSVRTKAPQPGPHQLEVSLRGLSPARLSAQVDNGGIIDEGIHGSGRIELKIPVPGTFSGDEHSVSLRIQGPTEGEKPPPMIFENAALQSLPTSSR